MAVMESAEIRTVLPHRYPFLLVDRILELEPGVRAVGTKNVTANEPFFQGHFPQRPIMPGVLMVEAAAQVGGVAILSAEEHQGKMVFFAGIDGVRFRRVVTPGDTLTMEVQLLRMRRGIGKGKATVAVGEEEVLSGELMFAVEEAGQ